ncbi:MAG: methyltransferase domain-containing protein [Acidobacteria bacterium]|nr:methyltransferase domain-containing protein [Acidobacteriota bacterium]MCI0626228.1 methyltransferase domain-containing protein [Acidobacteriota bacterium]MCI0724115.1 methyltransferase domain-containing protein [Acidobacteriota bacterium]
MSNHPPEASPAPIFDTINAYQRTAALKAAIELDLFTAIGEGRETAQTLSERCNTSERGMRIICDYMVVIGFLTKRGQHYGLTPDSAMFLDRRSPGYMGSATEFLLSPMVTDGFKDVAAAVRRGGTVLPEDGSLAPEHPMWVKFARAMAPMMSLPARLMAELVDKEANQKLKVLDIAAGHGLFGIAFAQRNPKAEIIAVDWPNVLEVAKENARKAVGSRYSTISGSGFEVDYGSDFDIALLTNFLHHFDVTTCEKLLKKVHAALAKDGRAVTLEFVPNEDRVSPPGPAAFSMMMLGGTPAGDAYTFSELDRMFGNAGFSHSELHPLPPTLEQLIISRK